MPALCQAPFNFTLHERDHDKMTKIISFSDYKKSKSPPPQLDVCGMSLEGLFAAAFTSWYENSDEELGDYFLGVLVTAWENGEWIGYVTESAYEQYVAYAKAKKRVVHPKIPRK